MGWSVGTGLGAAGDGRTTHIKVQQKLDMMGIGAAHQKDPNGLAWKQNKDFENLLRRLNAGGDGNVEAEMSKIDGFARASESKEEDGEADGQEKEQEKKRKREGDEDGTEVRKKKSKKSKGGDDEDGKKKKKKSKHKSKQSEDEQSTKARSPSPEPVKPAVVHARP